MVIRRLPGGAFLLTALLVMLGGCYVSLGTSQPPEDREVVALSVSSGGTVRSGDLVQISISLPEEDPESHSVRTAATVYTVSILLQDARGKEITQTDIPYRDGDDLPPLTLDDLQLSTGWYRLLVSLRQEDAEVGQKNVEFVYLGSEYALSEITSDASLVHPGSTVSLTADVVAPDGADPVLVWSAGGEPFAEGGLSQGADHALWTAPKDTGIYTVSVLLYPPGLQTSVEGLETVIYVAPVENPLGQLGPAESYLSLFHLVGNLDDSGRLGQPAEFLNDKPLRLITRGEWVGYRLDGIGGIVVDRTLLPETEGTLGPFSIIVGYTPDKPSPTGDLLSIATRDGRFLLTIGLDSEGILQAHLVQQDATLGVEASAAPLSPDMRYEIGFSLRPVPADDPEEDPTMEAVLFLDGQELAREAWPRLPAVDTDGTAIVGGPMSVTGVVDEVGIYDRDEQGRPSSDPGFFVRSLVLSSGPDARGDGFDGPYLSAGYVVSQDVRVVSGALQIPAGSSGTTPPYTIDPAGSSLRIRLSLGLAPSALVRLVWDKASEGEPPILELAGQASSGAPERIEFTLTLEGDQLRVDTASDATEGSKTTVPRASRDTIRVVVENPAQSDAALAVDDIAIWPTR